MRLIRTIKRRELSEPAPSISPLDIVVVGPYPADVNLMRGGVQAAVYGLTSGLSGSPRISSIRVFALPVRADARSWGAEYEIESCRIRYLTPPLKLLSSSLLHFPSILRAIGKLHSPLLNLHGTGVLQLFLLAASRATKTPAVWTVHGLTEKETLERYRRTGSVTAFLRYLLYRVLERTMARVASYIIADTGYVADSLKTSTTATTSAIPQGVTMREFDGILSKPQDQSLVSIGVLDDRKGHHLTIEAMAQVISIVPNARLTIVGSRTSDSYYNHLLTTVRQYNLASAVRVVPDASRGEILSILAGAKVFALHSREESQGIALCEAMAMGVPVVATSVGGIPDVVLDGHSGYLVEYGDVRGFAHRIVELLTDDERHRLLSETARTEARKLDWSKVIERVLVVFGEARLKS